jgi:hypothetical protein
MHRPDTIIEIHRERVQDQTVEMFGGDKYTEAVDGTGYSATATLDLTLDRVWFIFDSQQRLWQETDEGESHDPLRHFAIDLAIFDSRIAIDSVTCIPLVSLPPATITVPDGPRAGEFREIPYNEIPLFGRLTVHDQLEPRETEPGKQTIALDFTAQDSPVLLANPLRDEYGPRLFGPHIDRRSNGSVAFTGQDPRITWELDYAEAYWITHSIAGGLMVNLEKVQHPSLSDDEARIRVLDLFATQIADAVGPKLAEMGDGGVMELLPSPLDVDPNRRTTARSRPSTPSCNASTSAGMSRNPWWFSCKRCANCRPVRSCPHRSSPKTLTRKPDWPSQAGAFCDRSVTP